MIPFYHLKSYEKEYLLGHVAQRILAARPEQAQSIVACSNRVYIFSYKSPISFEEPFDCFDKVVDIIGKYKNILDNIGEVIQEIEEATDENFLFEIFPRPQFGVQGYLCLIDEEREEIYVVFFGYKSTT